MASIEVPKELVDKVYEIIETAKSTGKIMKGTNETTKAIEKGKAKLVAIAKDVNPPEIIMHIPIIAEEKDVPCFTVPSKEELGAASGIQVGTGSVAVTEEGESKNLIKELLTKSKQ
ncbi:MAG: 50S ribosomal protein L7ae [Nanoarchaeota archaeon]|nr:50S ribosomal protein L7ae [Nanoarchaeota archaeon]